MEVSIINNISKQKINAMIESLRSLLINKNISKNDRVAFVASYDYVSVVCFMAIWSVGAVCVPINHKSPKNKVEDIIKEAQAKYALVMPDNDVFSDEIIKINIDNLTENTIKNNENSINIFENNNDELAYIVFTSGTTSKPKGVAVSWRNIKNYVKDLILKLNLTNSDVGMITTSLAFDLSYTILFSALFNGSKLVIPTEKEILNPLLLLDTIHNSNVSYIKTTPSILKMLVCQPKDILKSKLHNLKLLILGGEPINFNDVQIIKKTCPNVRVINHYGPCEATVGCCMLDMNSVENEEDVSIGYPFANNSIDLVDENNNVVKDGASGRLLIYGKGVTNGYINADNLNFFVYKKQNAFLTEDIGSKNLDGSIKLLGRTNDFVKIKGYRVSLERVKKYVQSLDYVKNCVVFAQEINSVVNLFCCYVGDKINYKDFFDELSFYLAEYEIPRHLIKLEEIPFNSNGKTINKSILMQEFYKAQEQNINKQKNEILKNIYKCWYSVGGALNISTKDCIYDYIDSLSSIMFINSLEDMFNIKINEGDFYECCENMWSISNYVKNLTQ